MLFYFRVLLHNIIVELLLFLAISPVTSLFLLSPLHTTRNKKEEERPGLATCCGKERWSLVSSGGELRLNG